MLPEYIVEHCNPDWCIVFRCEAMQVLHVVQNLLDGHLFSTVRAWEEEVLTGHA